MVSFGEMWMGLETVIQSKVSQKVKNKHHRIWFVCGSQRNGAHEIISKAEIETQAQRMDVQLPKRKQRGGINWETGIYIRTLPMYEIMRTYCIAQGQRRSPSMMVGGAKLHLASNPIPSRDTQRVQTYLCVPGPRD